MRGDAAALRDHAAAARQAVDGRDIQALATESAALGKASDSFAGHSSGPQWWIAAHIPWVGDQVTPLRAAGTAVEGLTADALGPLSKLQGLDALDTPKFVDGRIDPKVLEPYRPTLETASEAVHREQQALAAVNLDHTVGAVKRPFASLVADLDSVGAILDNANALAQLLPSMLGADGPRHYAVIVQNNAEPRVTGGDATVAGVQRACNGRSRRAGSPCGRTTPQSSRFLMAPARAATFSSETTPQGSSLSMVRARRLATTSTPP
ncbi:hypothetical protein [Demequina lutea]|uniref:Uncharacterized protein n=1 Tax=Demequina lutea TaxID=431489 RepID=A0A7Y9Z7Q1_9MICO|nr:hypothetical protein [Demequina lutea]NYI40387.1 hypothetical protein [Demequina lutea]